MKQNIQPLNNDTPTFSETKITLGDTASSDTGFVKSLDLVIPLQEGEDSTTIDLFTTDTHQLITHLTDSIITQREGFTAEELPLTLAGNPWIIILLILTFSFFAISYHRGAKYLHHTLKSIFKANTRGNMFDETTINENQLKLSLLTTTFVTEGITIYYSWLDNLVTNSKYILPAIALCITICATYFLLQRFVYNILGNIFSDRQQTQLFDEGFTIVNQLVGLFLTPFVLVMIFVPDMAQIAVNICFIVYILSRLIIIYKGIRFFSLQIFGLLYLILYLCALEITPFFLIKRVVINVYSFFEFNFLQL